MPSIQQLAAGGSFPTNGTTAVIYSQDPNPLSCNDVCVIPPTPPSTVYRPLSNQLKREIKITVTAPTGPTGTIFDLGFGLRTLADRNAWETCFNGAFCSDILDSTPFFTDSSAEGSTTGVECLGLYNQLTSVAGVVISNLRIKTSGDLPQLGNGLIIASADFFNQNVCAISIDASDCSICNPAGGVQTLQTFNLTCPVNIDQFNGLFYLVNPGQTITFIACIDAANLSNTYIAGNGGQITM